MFYGRPKRTIRCAVMTRRATSLKVSVGAGRDRQRFCRHSRAYVTRRRGTSRHRTKPLVIKTLRVTGEMARPMGVIARYARACT